MTSIFSKPKTPDNTAALRAQRRQDQAMQQQGAEESKELGARRRIAAARASGRNSLFSSQGGTAGVQTTFG